MRNKVINFIIQEKDNICYELEDMVYPDILQTFKPLTCEEIEKIDNLRKQILECYALIDILGGND